MILVGTFLNGQALDPRYHTPAELQALLEEWDSNPDYDELYQLQQIGTSAQDSLPIYAVKISDNVTVDEDEPELLFLGQCHAEEILGVEIVLDFARRLLDPSPGESQHMTILRDNLEIWIVPTHNPEGFGVVHSGADVTYRKNKRDTNDNGMFDYVDGVGGDLDGVDLNRNYDFNWIHGDTLWSTQTDPDYPALYDYYRGETPFSEPEIRAVRDLALERRFNLSVAFHSSRSGRLSEQLFYPWNWQGKHPPDFDIIHDMGQILASRIVNEAGDGTYQPIPSTGLSGNAHNWFYAATGCYQYLMEVGTANLQPDSLTIEDTINRVLAGVYYLCDRALGYQESSAQVHIVVSDAVTGDPVSARIQILDREAPYLSPRMTDESGSFRQLLLPGGYSARISAEGYIPEIVTFSVNNSAVTNLPVMLGTADPREITLFLDIPPTYTGDLASAITTEYGIDTLIHQDVLTFSVQDGPVAVLTRSISPEAPYILQKLQFEVSADTVITGELTLANLQFTDNFTDLEHWEFSTGEWTIREGALVSQTGEFYDSDYSGELVSRFTTHLDSDGNLALFLSHRYEIEWEADSVWIAITGRQSGERHTWSRSGHQFNRQEEWFISPPLTGPDSFEVSLGITSDSYLEYRGWEIDSLAVFTGSFYNLATEPIKDREPAESFGRLEVQTPYPNPSWNGITVRVAAPTDQLNVKVYNLLGHELYSSTVPASAGRVQWHWSGMDKLGQAVPTGIYFVQFSTRNEIETRKWLYFRD